MSKLESHHKHFMRLIDRDKDPDGWVTVSATVMPAIMGDVPTQLVEVEITGKDGSGRARLTTDGQNLISAMEWL